MVCPKCKSQLPEGSSFCPRCGVRIVTERRCPKCQSIIAADSAFCPKCGAQMAGSAPARPGSVGTAPAPASVPASAPPAKKRIFTLKNFLIVLVVGIVFRGVGYLMGSNWSSSSKSASSAPNIGANINTNLGSAVKLKKDFDVNTVLTKDYTVSLADATVYEDDEGNPILIVKYNFTNNSSVNQSFSGATYDKAFQNGVQVAPVILIGTTASQYDYDPSLTAKEVQPGRSLEVERAYSLDHPTADVEVEVVTHGTDPVTLLQSTILLPE